MQNADLGEKLCRIIRKIWQKSKGEDRCSFNKHGYIVVTDGNVDQHSKEAILMGLIFVVVAHKAFMHIAQCHKDYNANQ